MSFLKKMFGKKDPVEEARQLHARQEWAGVLSATGRISREELDSALLAEVTTWENDAGDALARINIEEGLWAQKSHNLLRAREDFQLAMTQARTSELKKRAEQALAALDQGILPVEIIDDNAGSVPHTSCSSCAPSAAPVAVAQETDLDEEGRLELLLATMAPEMAKRYMDAGLEFRQAWLAAQDGDDPLAMKLIEKVPAAERNALFLFERGALMARSGQHQKARQDLQAALTAEPDMFQAFEALIDVLAASGRTDDLEKTLKQSLTQKRFVGYCWARLAELHAHRGASEPALAAGMKALEEGMKDQGLILLCAQLLELAGRFDEAEALLMRMPAGGCGGGAHPMLAEFWLRRGRNLDKALESFKGAMRQEAGNPRWLLRVAQVYQAKGWRKDAIEQVERLMQQSNLPEQIRSELKIMADQLQKG